MIAICAQYIAIVSLLDSNSESDFKLALATATVQVSGEAAHSVRDPRPVTASAVTDGSKLVQ